jgi:hypothetical protein
MATGWLLFGTPTYLCYFAVNSITINSGFCPVSVDSFFSASGNNILHTSMGVWNGLAWQAGPRRGLELKSKSQDKAPHAAGTVVLTAGKEHGLVPFLAPWRSGCPQLA